MQAFSYKAVDRNGKVVTGTLEANTKQEIINILREKQQRPISVDIAKKSMADIKIGGPKKVKTVDLSVFCRQLSTMLKAGLALDRALSTQIQQTENSGLRDVLTEVLARVKQGQPFSKGLAEHPKVFPKLLIGMVEAGEATGGLDDSLHSMAQQFDRDNKINRRIKGAMIYPIVLLSLTVVIATGLIIFIVPTFAEMFEGLGSALPGPTQFLVDLSESLGKYWFIYIAVIAGLVFLIRTWLASKEGRMTWDTWKLSMPVVKKPMLQIITARFTQTLSTMLASGISLVNAIEAAADTCNNAFVKKKVDQCVDGIKKGGTITAQLRGINIFPEMMLSMIGIGEETGDLDGMLAKTAEYYSDEFDAAIGQMLAILEPLLIILMAIVIGGVVIALYLPMFEIIAVMS